MVSIKWIRQNDHLVQYLAFSNGSHLKIRIFLSKQLHSPRSHILQRILHVYYRSQWLFHLCLSQTKHNIVTDPTPHTKAFHKLNADFAKFLFILDLLYSEEANNQQHFHAVLNNLFLQKLWVALQLTPGTRQIFFQTMRLHFHIPQATSERQHLQHNKPSKLLNPATFHLVVLIAILGGFIYKIATGYRLYTNECCFLSVTWGWPKKK